MDWKPMLASVTGTVFSCYKRTFGTHMRAKRAGAQEREAAIACTVLNRMRAMGRPHSYRVS